MSPLVVTPRIRQPDRLTFVQRLFSMFPTAGPGVALVLLRVAVAASLLAGAPGAEPVAPTWITAPLGTLLCLGVLTPILASFAAIALGAAAIARPTLEPALATFMLAAAALALLGPGAYSFDAWRFGRRLVVAPDARDHVE